MSKYHKNIIYYRAVNVGLVRVIFPYKHRFAEAVQGEFVSLFKWLKIIHGIKKKPFTADSPLPSDLLIKVSVRANVTDGCLYM